MNDTTEKGAQQMPHREIPLPEGAGSLGGRKIDLLELAEEAVSLLCSDILREICTTGHLTAATYETVLELSVARGALAEMIGIMHPEVSIEQLAEGMEPQGMKLTAAAFYDRVGAAFGSDAVAAKNHADRREFVKVMQDEAKKKSAHILFVKAVGGELSEAQFLAELGHFISGSEINQEGRP